MDYNEILCQAIDTIVATRISELQFDETVVCTIVDDSNRSNGEYMVTQNNQLKFKAYSENVHYLNDQQVYVHIPKDSTQKKLILGRYLEDTDKVPLEYVSPFQQVVQMGVNLAGGITGVKQLIANNNAPKGDKILLAKVTNLPKDNRIYNTFCLKADFKSYLSKWDVRSGNYGIEAELISYKDGKIFSKIVAQLDSEQDMFGNPYSYSMFYPQEQIFKISLTEDVTELNIYAYQKANFKHNDGINAELQDVPVASVANIFINNIET